MRLFRILFGFDVLGWLVLGYFFFAGLQYRTQDYLALWLPILLVPAAVLAGAWVLRGKGKLVAANILLGVLSLPFLFALAVTGLFILFPPDFR